MSQHNIPLLSCTSKPIIYNTFSFGGDDFLADCVDMLPNDHRLLKELLDIKKKYYDNKDNLEMHDEICEEYRTCTQAIIKEAKSIVDNEDLNDKPIKIKEALDGFISLLQNDENQVLKQTLIENAQNVSENFTIDNKESFIQSIKKLQELGQNIAVAANNLLMVQSLSSNNKQQLLNGELRATHNWDVRMALVDALGGEEFCSKIPIFRPERLDDYMYFGIKSIPDNHSIAQYEDKAGRKGIVLKLKHKETGDLAVMWAHQRYRETAFSSYGSGGDYWTGKADGKSFRNMDEIIKFLKNPDNQYELLYKSGI